MLRLCLALTAASLMLAAQPKKDDPFLAGPPFTFADLQKAAGVVFEGRLKLAIERRGLAAPLTDAQLDQLKTAGAPPLILDAIRAAIKPPPAAPAPPKPVAGRLTLQCAPAECDILLNGAPAGRTNNGLLELRNLPPGEAVIDFRRPGYQGEQLTVAIDPHQTRVKSVRLNPDAETMKKNGRDLLQKLTAKIGTADPPALTLNGTAILWTGGQRSDWQLSASTQPTAQIASLEIQGAGVKWRSTLKAGAVKSDGSGKLKGGPIALEMEKLVRLFSAYQPAALVKRLRADGAQLLAPDERPEDRGHRLLRAQVGADNFLIQLAPDGTPVRVETGGIELRWTQFEPLAAAFYPRAFLRPRPLPDKPPPTNSASKKSPSPTRSKLNRMPTPPQPRHAVSQAVPFFHVADMDASLRFYQDGLGFVRTKEWKPDGLIRWCWLELDRVALMLQRRRPIPAAFRRLYLLFCHDAVAVYRDLQARGLSPSRPFVGNGLWVTSITDPDGHRLDFEAPPPSRKTPNSKSDAPARETSLTNTWNPARKISPSSTREPSPPPSASKPAARTSAMPMPSAAA